MKHFLNQLYKILNNSHGRVLYETSSENTLKNMKDSNIFLKTVEDPDRGCLWNG